jgi:hypothetical protein
VKCPHYEQKWLTLTRIVFNMPLPTEAFNRILSLEPLDFRIQQGLAFTMRQLSPREHKTLNAAFQFFQYNFEGFRRKNWLHIEKIILALEKFLEMANPVLSSPMGSAARSAKAKEITSFIERRYCAEYANMQINEALSAVPIEYTVYWRRRFLECLDVTSAVRRQAERGVRLCGIVSK